ncbi:hypothetical protein B0H13DRAFT_1853309 [Mycena leptocephala]|nr:hypothetical protein B0H13DRAFT_1853309 [Mycena leptocephala]
MQSKKDHRQLALKKYRQRASNRDKLRQKARLHMKNLRDQRSVSSATSEVTKDRAPHDAKYREIKYIQMYGLVSFRRIYEPMLNFYGAGHLANVKLVDETTNGREVVPNEEDREDREIWKPRKDRPRCGLLSAPKHAHLAQDFTLPGRAAGPQLKGFLEEEESAMLRLQLLFRRGMHVASSGSIAILWIQESKQPPLTKPTTLDRPFLTSRYLVLLSQLPPAPGVLVLAFPPPHIIPLLVVIVWLFLRPLQLLRGYRSLFHLAPFVVDNSRRPAEPSPRIYYAVRGGNIVHNSYEAANAQLTALQRHDATITLFTSDDHVYVTYVAAGMEHLDALALAILPGNRVVPYQAALSTPPSYEALRAVAFAHLTELRAQAVEGARNRRRAVAEAGLEGVRQAPMGHPHSANPDVSLDDVKRMIEIDPEAWEAFLLADDADV